MQSLELTKCKAISLNNEEKAHLRLRKLDGSFVTVHVPLTFIYDAIGKEVPLYYLKRIMINKDFVMKRFDSLGGVALSFISGNTRYTLFGVMEK